MRSRAQALNHRQDGGLDLFPFAEVRPGQREFLEDARATLAAGEHLVAHAPPGIGKTAAALAAALEVGLAQGKKVLFLTARQSQHHIAVETLRAIKGRFPGLIAVDAISKQAMCLYANTFRFYGAFHEFCNFMVQSRSCRYFYNRDDGLPAILREAPLHAQELVALGRQHATCPHRVAMEAAREAHVVVGDYNYLFSDPRDRILRHLGCSLQDLIVVVDEAHNLPDRIRAELAVDLTPDDVLGASQEARRFDRRLSKRLGVLAEALRFALAGAGEEGRVEPGFLEDPLHKALGPPAHEPDAEEAFLTRIEELGRQLMPIQGRSALLDLSVFLHRWGQTGPGVFRTAVPGDSARLTCRLLDASAIAGPIFAAIHGSIVMSATLHPAEMFADLLGVDPLRRRVAAYTSPFPPANRAVLALTGLTTRYDARSPEMTSAYARTINSLAAQVPGNAAVFFPSYELLSAVRGVLAGLPPAKPLVWEERGMEKAKREGLLGTLRAARAEGGLLLLGVLAGGLSEGIDYEGNLLEAVLVAGLPLSPPSVEVEALREYLDRRLGPSKGYAYAYLYPAVNRVLQAAGRCIRDKGDRAVVLLLDGRFVQPRYRRYFPADFPLRPVGDPVAAVRAFFAGAQSRPVSVGSK